jgi:hypothetical protein
MNLKWKKSRLSSNYLRTGTKLSALKPRLRPHLHHPQMSRRYRVFKFSCIANRHFPSTKPLKSYINRTSSFQIFRLATGSFLLLSYWLLPIMQRHPSLASKHSIVGVDRRASRLCIPRLDSIHTRASHLIKHRLYILPSLR